MLIDVILGIIGYLLTGLAHLLPTWSIWPSSVLDGLSYFVDVISGVNFIAPIDVWFTAGLFLLNFFVLYFSAKIITRVIGLIRGTGKGVDLQ